ncbi:MAG: hypothetical protein EOM91_03700 [Sphingobacteriia bacterium]|nr:hypothetical protein [Sphingobacteriia bacterium]NCC39750.1 hypothetical protein [Gammaproteobacteria bacterium]
MCGGLLLNASHPAHAQDLIAHPSTGVDSLSRNEARLLFTMRVKQWPDGTPVKVFVLPDNDALHGRFVSGLLELYPYQLRRVWDRQLFSGTGQAPVTVANEHEMMERVASNPGAIGYVSGPFDPTSVRILEVR